MILPNTFTDLITDESQLRDVFVILAPCEH